MPLNPMDTAPTDGTRVLIKHTVFHFCHRARKYLPDGTQWVEAHYVEDRWLEWCGNPKTFTTCRLTPLGWAPLPDECHG